MSLRIEGGLATVLSGTFVHPDCPYFKVAIEFTRKTGDSFRTAPPMPDDLVAKVSRPYLGRPALD